MKLSQLLVGTVAVGCLLTHPVAIAQAPQPNPAADLATCSRVASLSQCSCYQKTLLPRDFAVVGKIASLSLRTDINDDAKMYQLKAAMGSDLQSIMSFQSGMGAAEKQCGKMDLSGKHVATTAQPPARTYSPPVGTAPAAASQRSVSAEELERARQDAVLAAAKAKRPPNITPTPVVMDAGFACKVARATLVDLANHPANDTDKNFHRQVEDMMKDSCR